MKLSELPENAKLADFDTDIYALDSIEPHPENPREHPESQYAKLCMMLERFTYTKGSVVVQKGTTLIIAGSGIYESLIREGFTHVRAVVADLDDPRALEFMIADNRVAELSTYNMPKLTTLFVKLKSTPGAMLEATSFQLPEISKMIESQEGPKTSRPDAWSDIDETHDPIIFTNDDEIAAAMAHYRGHGFPYPDLPDHRKIGIFRALQSKSNPLQEKDTISPDTFGSTLAISFHPHYYDAHVIGADSPAHAFDNNDLLRAALVKVKEYKSNPIISDVYLRNMLLLIGGSDVCAQFRPVAAKSIYEIYAPARRGLNILDMSTGYGGRLLGFLSSGIYSHSTYHGVDPHPETCAGNLAMAKVLGAEKHVKIYQTPFEDFDLDFEVGKIDMMFTSPPYFKKEVHGEADTQSAIRYPEYAEWLEKFWLASLDKIAASLAEDGIIVINIQDVTISETVYKLVEHTKKHMRKLRFKLAETLEMELVWVNSDLTNSEPILIYRRMAKSRKKGKTKEK